MPAWTFWDYVDAQDRNQIRIWLDSFREKTRTKIRTKLVSVFEIPNAVGYPKLPRYEMLKGQHSELIAIRWERDKIQYRVFACYGSEARKEIWLLAGGTEKNNNYRPPGILETALARREDILTGKGRVTATCLLNNN